jgi:hypothetical protein
MACSFIALAGEAVYPTDHYPNFDCSGAMRRNRDSALVTQLFSTDRQKLFSAFSSSVGTYSVYRIRTSSAVIVVTGTFDLLTKVAT